MTYKLLCLDMDGVIFEEINFWMKLHQTFGTLEKGKVLTGKYLHTDYDRLVKEVVVNLWKGKDAKLYHDLVNSIKYLPGVSQMFDHVKSKDYITAIISSSTIDLARRVEKDFGVDHVYANELVIRNEKVFGEFVWPVGAGREKKAEIIRHLCQDLEISLKEVIYIGDQEIDIEAFKEVGLSIAFNSDSEELKKVADHVVESNNLADVLRLLP